VYAVGTWITAILLASRKEKPDWIEEFLLSAWLWYILLPWILAVVIHEKIRKKING
jgi:hypothetical protein